MNRIEEDLRTFLVRKLDFTKHPQVEAFFATHYPEPAVENCTLSYDYVSQMIRGTLRVSAKAVEHLALHRVLSPSDREYLLQNEKRSGVRIALLRAQEWTPSEVRSFASKAMNSTLAQYLVRDATRLGIEPIDAAIVDHCPSQVAFAVLLRSPVGTYHQHAAKWLLKASDTISTSHMADIALWAALLNARPDLVESVRSTRSRSRAVRSALCLSGLEHDAEQQIRDLGLDTVLQYPKGSPVYTAQQQIWVYQTVRIAKVVLGSPFTRAATVEAIRDVAGDSLDVSRLCDAALGRIEQFGEVLVDPCDVTDPLVHKYVREWRNSYSENGKGRDIYAALHESMAKMPNQRPSAHYVAAKELLEKNLHFDPKVKSAKENNAALRRIEESVRASLYGNARMSDALKDTLVSEPYSLVKTLEAQFGDHVEFYVTLLALSESWDGTPDELIRTVMNLH